MVEGFQEFEKSVEGRGAIGHYSALKIYDPFSGLISDIVKARGTMRLDTRDMQRWNETMRGPKGESGEWMDLWLKPWKLQGRQGYSSIDNLIRACAALT